MSPRAGIDKDIVVEAAARLMNAEGVEALSLGRLAKMLGIQTPSLYNHIHGLDGLRRELALLNTRLLYERLAHSAIGKSGPAAAMAIALAYRDHIREQSGVYLSSLRASGSQEIVDAELQQGEARVVEVALAVIASFGLRGDDALHAARGLRSLVHGFATLEVAGGFGLPLDLDESFRRLVEMYVLGLQRFAG